MLRTDAPPAPGPGAAPAARLRALDIFRGATVALMILVNNPGSWNHLYPPLAHAAWHGTTPTDLVFPFFLFAVGNALAFVLPGLQQAPPAVFWRRVGKRTVLIFGIGLLLNLSPFVRWDEAGALVPRSLDTLRVMGVLQRIALAFGGAAVVVRLVGTARAAPAALALLVAYWIACRVLGAAGDPYSLGGFFGTGVDRALLGAAHLYRGEGVPFDPEGLASTLPAVAQVLLGVWVGEMVRQRGRPADPALVARLFLGATLLGAAAYAWQLEMPLNKKLWTSSYVLLSTALAMAALAAVIHVVDVRRRPAEQRVWAPFCEVFGRNALAVFVLSGLVPRLLALLRWPAAGAAGPDGAAPVWTSPLSWLYRAAFAPLADAGADPRLPSLLFAVANLAAYWWLARVLSRRGIFIRV